MLTVEGVRSKRMAQGHISRFAEESRHGTISNGNIAGDGAAIVSGPRLPSEQSGELDDTLWRTAYEKNHKQILKVAVRLISGISASFESNLGKGVTIWTRQQSS